jgi:hypothetical protein
MQARKPAKPTKGPAADKPKPAPALATDTDTQRAAFKDGKQALQPPPTLYSTTHGGGWAVRIVCFRLAKWHGWFAGSKIFKVPQ